MEKKIFAKEVLYTVYIVSASKRPRKAENKLTVSQSRSKLLKRAISKIHGVEHLGSVLKSLGVDTDDAELERTTFRLFRSQWEHIITTVHGLRRKEAGVYFRDC